MTTEIAKKETFEEKMKARIIDSIGDLMPDEELQKIISKSIDEAFFQKIVIQEGYHKKELDPWIYGVVKDLLQDHMKKQVELYMKEHKDVILDNINDIVKNGISECFVSTIKNYFSQQFFDFEMNIKNKMDM